MPARFTANLVSVEEEHGVLVVALSGPSTEDEDFYLVLQHKDEYDEQDTKSGMNKPHIEYCGQGWSWYGHINRFEIQRDRIKVEMNAVAAERMGGDGKIEVAFSIDEQAFSNLHFALKRVFRAQSYFVETA